MTQTGRHLVGTGRPNELVHNVILIACLVDEDETLSNRRGVLDAAGVPELIEPARNLQLRFGADIALIDFAVIADMADDAHDPVFGQPEFFAIGAFVSFANWREAEDLVSKFGAIIKSPNGHPMQSPYVIQANQQRDAMLRCAVELGLTPASRLKFPRRNSITWGDDVFPPRN